MTSLLARTALVKDARQVAGPVGLVLESDGIGYAKAGGEFDVVVGEVAGAVVGVVGSGADIAHHAERSILIEGDQRGGVMLW